MEAGIRPAPLFQTIAVDRRALRDGQSLVESCFAVALICLIFMGLFQVSQIYAAREILAHAAARAARAKTVGFRSWMIDKAVLVAAIPNAGKLTEPVFDNEDLFLREQVATSRPGALWDTLLSAQPSSMQYNLESARIPWFMGSYDRWEASYILDYDRWHTIHTPGLMSDDPADSNLLFTVRVSQTFDLTTLDWIHRAFYAADSVRLSGEATIEKHYPLYLDADPTYYYY